jgi:arginine deiminase
MSITGSAARSDRAPADPIAPRANRLGVSSEVGRLRRVILHRPGFELARIPRARVANLPWREVDRGRRAREEHDSLADALGRRGVEVLYLSDLLVEALEVTAARDEVIAGILASVGLTPRVRSALARYLVALSPLELGARMLGGVSIDELALAPRGRPARPEGRNGIVLPPLDDALLVRRASAWIRDGVAVDTTCGMGCCRRSIAAAAIYRHHPAFTGHPQPAWTGGLIGPTRMDGNDVFVLGAGSVLITCSEGTNGISAALLAERLFADAAVRRVILASSPFAPAGGALCNGIAMLDRDAFVVRRGLRKSLLVHSLRSDDGGLLVDREPDLLTALGRALEAEPVRAVEPVVSGPATGVLAIAPGTVLAFDEPGALDALRDAGVEVIGVAGSELARYRATPRALVCPIERDPAPTT